MYVKLGYSAAIIAVAGISVVAANYDHRVPHFYVGLVLCTVAGVCAVGACIARVAMSLDDAWQHGFRVGYRKGRRQSVPLSLVRDDSA